MLELGNEIKRLREEYGMTQAELAGDYTTASYISLIERNKVVPSKKILRSIAQRLGKPLYYFESQTTNHSPQELNEKIERLHTLARVGRLDQAQELASELREEETDLWDKSVRGRYSMAMGYLAYALKNPDDALYYYRQAYGMFDEIGYKHKIIEALFGIGAIHALRHDFELAVGYLKRARELEHQEQITEPDTLYDLQLMLANCLVKIGKSHEAGEIFTSLYQTNPKDYDKRISLLINLAESCKAEGEIDTALEYASEARKLADEYGDLINRALIEKMSADALTKDGRYQEAGIFLDRALQGYLKAGSHEGQARSINKKACLAILKKDLEAAQEHIHQVSAITGLEDTLVPAELRVTEARLMIAQDNKPGAIEQLQHAAQGFVNANQFKRASDLLEEVATIYRELGNDPKAYQALSDALALFRKSTISQD